VLTSDPAPAVRAAAAAVDNAEVLASALERESDAASRTRCSTRSAAAADPAPAAARVWHRTDR
jgi:hypothetical protein